MGKPWYVDSFQEDYLKIYAHRNDEAAQQEVAHIVHLLGMKPGSQVLDLCCGHGRHSRALAQRGFQVTGLDLSQVLLDEAVQRSKGLDICYVQGDVRQLPFQQQFDYVLNLFTSFGYFDDLQENVGVFQGINRALKPGGRFLIDFLNPGYVQKTLQPYTEREVDQLRIIEQRAIQDGRVLKTIEVIDRGQVRKYTERVHLFSREEMEAMLSKAGLQVTAIYGDLEQTPYHPTESPRMVIVGDGAEQRSAQ